MNRQEIEVQLSEVWSSAPEHIDYDKRIRALARWHITKQIELLEQVKGKASTYHLNEFPYESVDTEHIDTIISNLKKEL